MFFFDLVGFFDFFNVEIVEFVRWSLIWIGVGFCLNFMVEFRLLDLVGRIIYCMFLLDWILWFLFGFLWKGYINWCGMLIFLSFCYLGLILLEDLWYFWSMGDVVDGGWGNLLVELLWSWCKVEGMVEMNWDVLWNSCGVGGFVWLWEGVRRLMNSFL